MEPNLLALLFADRIITENNGKKGLIGVFTNFQFSKFPAKAPPWSVFVALDNIPDGSYDFAINVVRKSNQQVAFSAGGKLEVKQGAEGVELNLPIPTMVFPGDGMYLVSVVLNGIWEFSRNLNVKLQEQPKGDD